MDRTDERIKNLIRDHLGVDREKITEDARIMDDLGADSLDAIELIMAVEEEFEIEIPDEQAEKVETVNDMVKLVGAKLEAKGAE